MSYTLQLPRLAAFAAAMLTATASLAAPSPPFRGLDTISAAGGIPPTVPSSGNAATARGVFEKFVTEVAGTETFEGFGLSASLNTGLFGKPGGFISGAGALENEVFGEDTSFSGRWNTSTPCNFTAQGGCNWFNTSGTFTLAFGTRVSAFGFYGTDFGDFNATVTISLLRLTDGMLQQVGSDLPIPSLENSNNGSLLFYGIVDTDTPGYDGIRFNITQRGSTDVFGFDDFIIGNVEQEDPTDPGPLPEPGTLALVGLAIAGLAASRRRKRT